jgi:hypothetical protein
MSGQRVRQLTTPAAPPRAPRPLSSILRSVTSHGIASVPNPEQAFQMGLLHGVPPDPRIKAFYGEKAYAHAQKAQLRYIAAHEGIKPTNDLTNAILLGTGAGDVAALLKGVGQVGASELAGAGAEAAAKTAASTGETTGLKRLLGAGLAKRTARQGIVRPVVKRAAAKAEPAAVTEARQGLARRVGQQVGRLPKPVRVAGKVGAQTVTYPIKHPFTAPLTAQTPLAIYHGDINQYGKAFTGTGAIAGIGNAVGSAISGSVPGKVAQNIVKDAFNLPATVLPSVYLTAAGIVEATQGDPKRLTRLWDSYMKTGAVPALLQGHMGAALTRIKAHPLYTGLELSGVASVAGRGAGILTRGAGIGRDLSRPARTIEGYPNIREVRGPYSKDLFRQGAQRWSDRRSGNVIRPGTRRGDKQFKQVVVKDASVRFQAKARADEQLHKLQAVKLLHKARPTKGRLMFKRTDNASADVLSHAIERTIQHPESFYTDLQGYKAKLDAVYATGKLDAAQAAANRLEAKQMETALKHADPAKVHVGAEAFIEAHKPIVAELVARKVITKDQATTPAGIPFSRVHMDSGHGLSNADKVAVGEIDKALAESRLTSPERLALRREKLRIEKGQQLDAQGNPLSHAQVAAEMGRRGIEAPGFLSHRTPTRGDFWKPWYPDRARMPRGTRTGASVLTGRAADYASVVHQLLRSRGLLDRVKTYDKWITRFGVDLHKRGVTVMADAPKVLRDPAAWGLNPNVAWRAVPRYPWGSMKGEIQGALEHQDPSVVGEGLVPKALDSSATAETVDQRALTHPDSKIVFVPDAAVQDMTHQFTPVGPAMRGLQMTSTQLKRAVLPFSPSYYWGNMIDNMIRTAIAGIGPHHFVVGYKLSKHMTPEAANSLLGGNFFGSVEKMAVHRTAEDLRNIPLVGPYLHFAARFRAFRPGIKRGPSVGSALDVANAASRLLLSANSLITEKLPQYGGLGKLAMHDVELVNGRMGELVRLQPGVLSDIAKGIENPDRMIRYEKGLEEIFGNWTRMSSEARKFLSNVAPFWTWTRAALTLVFKTMPAHHPILTGLLAAAAEMTQQERYNLGLDKYAPQPVPNWQQGGLPIRGGISSWSKYNSFGYSGQLLGPGSSLASAPIPYAQGVINNIAGTDWKGTPLTDQSPLGIGKAIVTSFAGSFVPGWNTVAGGLHSGWGYLSPVHITPPSAEPFLRSLAHSKQITVPAGGASGSSAGIDASGVFGGSGGGSSGGSGVDASNVFGGG